MADAKAIGLGVKDTVLGLVTVVAGAYAGPAGAAGGQQASKGIDKLLGMAGVKEDEAPPPPSPSRAEQLERTDSARRQSLAENGPTVTTPPFVPSRPEPAAPMLAQKQLPAAPMLAQRQLPAAPMPAQRQLPAAPMPPVPQVVQELIALGYTPAMAQQIVAGEWSPPAQAAVAGQRVATVEGTLVKGATGEQNGFAGSTGTGGFGEVIGNLMKQFGGTTS